MVLVVGGLFDDDAHLCERFAEFVHRFGQRLDFVFAQGVVTGVVVAAVFRLVVLVEQRVHRLELGFDFASEFFVFGFHAQA